MPLRLRWRVGAPHCGGVARLTCWQTLRTGCGGSSLVGGCSPSPGSPCNAAAPSPSPCRTAVPVGHHWAWCNAQSVADPPPSWTTSPSGSTEDNSETTINCGQRFHVNSHYQCSGVNSLVMPSTSNLQLFADIDVFDNRVPAECQLTELISPKRISQTFHRPHINNWISRGFGKRIAEFLVTYQGLPRAVIFKMELFKIHACFFPYIEFIIMHWSDIIFIH